MANRWLQTKPYRCPSCQADYLHDRAHEHHCFKCPARPRPQPKPAVPLPVKIYSPATGRDRWPVQTSAPGTP